MKEGNNRKHTLLRKSIVVGGEERDNLSWQGGGKSTLNMGESGLFVGLEEESNRSRNLKQGYVGR